MAMDVEWALEQLRRFVAMTATHNTGDGWVLTARSNKEIIPAAPVVERILHRVTPSWPGDVPDGDLSRWDMHREGAQRAIALLEREAELREKLGEDAPTLDASRFHPWVWDGARSMWQSRHYRQGVVDALKKVNAEAQNKTHRHDLSETDLFTQLFSANPPKAAEPRLRLTDDDGSDTFRNVHRGARALAEGLFAGIRNVVAHTVAETEADEQHALEQLAAVSVLARWVADARVVTGP